LVGVGIALVNSVPRGRAPARRYNCGCQCVSPSLTFIDSSGYEQGNCKSTHEGKRWCFVDYQSSCTDKWDPHHAYGKYVSYQACTTPAWGEPGCGYKELIEFVQQI